MSLMTTPPAGAPPSPATEFLKAYPFHWCRHCEAKKRMRIEADDIICGECFSIAVSLFPGGGN